MHKRILIAEASDAVRNAAESILRQNGFEVISVSTSDKALEVIEFTRPDLLVVGSDLAASGRPFYERLQQEPRTASLPMLLISDAEATNLPFPDEVLVPQPLDPRSFLQKVMVFAGQNQATHGPAEADPLSDTSLEDEMLDAALGLDQIQVTESEVMDKAVMPPSTAKKPSSDKMVGLGSATDADDEASDSGRVESIMIESDSTDIVQKPKSKAPPSTGTTGKLDIVRDQYGLSDPDSLNPGDSDASHDYEWFVNEMRSDNQPSAPGNKPPSKVDPNESVGLSVIDPSAMVDPITSPPASTSTPDQSAKGTGVEKFIEEFKKEVEKINADQPESIVISETEPQGEGKSGRMEWDEKLEDLTPEQMQIFTREFTAELADRLAERIAAKIDDVKLLALLKHEIVAQLKKTVEK